MNPLNSHTRSEGVSDGACGRGTAVDELDGDGVSMWGGLQAILHQDGGIQEAVGRARVDEGLDGDRRLAGYDEVYQEAEVVGKGGGKGGGGGRVAPPSQAPTGWENRFLAPRAGYQAGCQTGGGGWA